MFQNTGNSLPQQVHGGTILEFIRADQKESVISCIYIQFCMQAEGYSERNMVINALIYKCLAKRKVVIRFNKQRHCVCVYLYSVYCQCQLLRN